MCDTVEETLDFFLRSVDVAERIMTKVGLRIDADTCEERVKVFPGCWRYYRHGVQARFFSVGRQYGTPSLASG